MIELLTVATFSYFLGSVPFGLVLTHFAGLGDIRKIGSGNIGATNVLRTGRKELAVLTVLLDGGKGGVAVLLAELLFPGMGALAGLASLLGHLFPVWLNFKGGKGVATALGIFLALAWPVSIAAMLSWLIVAALLRYSSLAALIAVGLTPLTCFLFGYTNLIWLAVVSALLVFYKHKGNIERLIAGTEPKIGKSGKNAEKKPDAQ